MLFSMKETGQRRTKGARKYRTESAVDVETVGSVGDRRKCVRKAIFHPFHKTKNFLKGA